MEGLFYCDKCDRVFTSQGILNIHKKRHRPDTSEKRHQCPLCPYASKYSSHLRQHTFTHSGERPFKCTQCEAGFTQKSLLRKHMLNHEAKEDATKSDKYIGNSKLTGHKKQQNNQSSTVKVASTKSNKIDNLLKEDIINEYLVKMKKTFVDDKKPKAFQSSTTKVSTKSNKLDQGQGDDLVKKNVKKIEKVCIGGDKKRQQAENSPQLHVLDYEPREDFTKIDKTFVDCKKKETHHSPKEALPKHCERCSKYLKDNKQLQKHLSMHRKKDKPHKCIICNKRFVTLSSLSRHDRKHHGATKSSAIAKELKAQTMNEPSKLTLSGIEMSPISNKSMSLQDDDLISDDKKAAATLGGLKPSKIQKKKTSINQDSATSQEIKSSLQRDKLCRKEKRAQSLSNSKTETTASNENETPSDVENAADVEEQDEAASQTISVDEDTATHETSENSTEKPEKSHDE